MCPVTLISVVHLFTNVFFQPSVRGWRGEVSIGSVICKIFEFTFELITSTGPPNPEWWLGRSLAFLVLSNLNTRRGSIIWTPPFLINLMRGSLALKMTVKHSALRSFACFVIEWLKKSIFYLICYGTEQSDLNWNDPDLPWFVIRLIIIPLGLYSVRIVKVPLLAIIKYVRLQHVVQTIHWQWGNNVDQAQI